MILRLGRWLTAAALGLAVLGAPVLEAPAQPAPDASVEAMNAQLAAALGRCYEGMVAKDPASPYRGGRTLSWLKVSGDELVWAHFKATLANGHPQDLHELERIVGRTSRDMCHRPARLSEARLC